MNYKWSRYLRMILVFLALTTGAGVVFGYPLEGLLAGLLLYLAWTLVQSRKLYQWLANPGAGEEAPESIGLWGDIFDGLHKLHRGTWLPRTACWHNSTVSRNPPMPCAMAW